MFVKGNLNEMHVYNLNTFSDVFTDDYGEDDGFGPRYGIYGNINENYDNVALAKYKDIEDRDIQYEMLLEAMQDERPFFEFAEDREELVLSEDEDEDEEEPEEEPKPKPKQKQAHKVVVFTETKEEALDLAGEIRKILLNKKHTD